MGKRQLAFLINVLAPFLGLILVVSLFSLSSEVRPYFLTGPNFKIILTQTVVVAICALGMTMIIVSGGIDLSVGAIVALSSVTGALLLTKGYSLPSVIAATVLVGGAVGMLNGTLIAGLKIMPFIVTLGMMGVARGIGKWISNNQAVNFPDSAINNLMALQEPDRFLPLPNGIWITVVLAVAVFILMRQTVFGRQIFAIGSNEMASRYSGIRVSAVKLCIYSFAGLLFGVGGLMQLSRLTQGDPTVGIGLELDVIAAVVIGGASLSGGSGSVLGSILGALIMATLRNGSNQMGWPTYMQEIIIGLVIIAAVALDRLRCRKLSV